MLSVIEYFAKSVNHSSSLKVIENGTIRKLGYGFLFAFHSSCILAVSTQYTNAVHSQPPYASSCNKEENI